MAQPDKAPIAALLDELKLWLRIEEGVEDALLFQLLRAATEAVEAHIGWLLIAREVEERGILCDARMRLAARPVRRVISASLVGASGETAIPDARLEHAGQVPAILYCPGVRSGAVRVRFVAGEADGWNGLAEALRLAVIRLAAYFYAHRDGGDDAGIPAAVERMLAPFRWRRLT